jgi:hypothetical protein
MVTVRLLVNVADDPCGAVLRVTEDRAKRLLLTGYAEPVVVEQPPRPVKRKGKE